MEDFEKLAENLHGEVKKIDKNDNIIEPIFWVSIVAVLYFFLK